MFHIYIYGTKGKGNVKRKFKKYKEGVKSQYFLSFSLSTHVPTHPHTHTHILSVSPLSEFVFVCMYSADKLSSPFPCTFSVYNSYVQNLLLKEPPRARLAFVIINSKFP